jgi:hypothetical protein
MESAGSFQLKVTFERFDRDHVPSQFGKVPELRTAGGWTAVIWLSDGQLEGIGFALIALWRTADGLLQAVSGLRGDMPALKRVMRWVKDEFEQQVPGPTP